MTASSFEPLAPESYRDLVRRALAEDIGPGDVTTRATVDPSVEARAVLLAKSRCVIAGLDVAVEAFRQLDDYFEGKRTKFTLPLHLGGTDFQNAVWTSLQRIPYGHTITYRDLAARIGRPAAIRAAGAANGANPLPIVVPCHRVIGSNGSLTGFGGGIEAKRFLLVHEQKFGVRDRASTRR